MRTFKLIVAAMLIISSSAMAKTMITSAISETVFSNVQCWAEGNTFRVNGSSNKEQLASARLFLNLKAEGDGVVITDVIGHVAGAKFVEGQKKLKSVDFYSQIMKTDAAIASSLSPRARKYPDDKYWRFRDVEETSATSQDGGGLNGTLVVSKKYSDKEVKEFDAHFVFQHGDHTGGTLDMTCIRD